MIKNIITRLVAMGKVKLIATGLAAIMTVGGIAGAVIYKINSSQKSDTTVNKNIKSKAERIEDLKAAYSKCCEDIEKIINIDLVYEPLKADLNEIGDIINSLTEESDIDTIENAESRIESMSNGIKEYMEKSLDVLNDKENELHQIDISSISEDIKNSIDCQNEEYYNLKNDKNYRMADAKITEIINFVRNAIAQPTSTDDVAPSDENAQNTSAPGESVSSGETGEVSSPSTGNNGGSSSKGNSGSSSNNGSSSGSKTSNPSTGAPSSSPSAGNSNSGNNNSGSSSSSNNSGSNNSNTGTSNTSSPAPQKKKEQKPSYPVMSWTTYNGMIGFFVGPKTDPYDALNYTNKMAHEHPEILNMSMISIDVGGGYVFEGWK